MVCIVAGISLVSGQQHYRVTVDGLNIRSGPGKNYNTVGVALKGDTLIAVHDVAGWTEITTKKNNIRGFVATQMIEKIEGSSAAPGSFWSFIGKLFKWIFIIAVLYFLYRWALKKLSKTHQQTQELKTTIRKDIANPVNEIKTEKQQLEEKITLPVVNEPAVDYKRTDSDYKEKGDAFEQFIAKKISENPFFSIRHWRSDKFVSGIFAQSNRHPDFEVAFSLTKNGEQFDDVFAIECKWRHYFFNEKIELEAYQLNNYRQYSQLENKAVYVVIGVGGKASDPETLFMVPLNEIENSSLEREFLTQFNYGVDDAFFYDYEKKKLELRG
jgi:hypothetical protein